MYIQIKKEKKRERERVISTQIMSNKNHLLGQFALDEVLLGIFSEYLSVDDVSRFDVAICNKAKVRVMISVRVQVRDRVMD
jgi:hypothetical protein